jgi:hypothetical protein
MLFYLGKRADVVILNEGMTTYAATKTGLLTERAFYRERNVPFSHCLLVLSNAQVQLQAHYTIAA